LATGTRIQPVFFDSLQKLVRPWITSLPKFMRHFGAVGTGSSG
jgi:hypothetical protein